MQKTLGEIISEITDMANSEKNKGTISGGILEKTLSIFLENSETIDTLVLSSKEELQQWMVIGLNMLHCMIDKELKYAPNEFMSCVLASDFLKSIEIEKFIPFDVDAITTHPIRFDERVGKIGGNLLFTHKPSDKNLHGLSGFNTEIKRALTASKNGAQDHKLFFMSLEFNYQGKHTSVLEMVLSYHPDIESIFTELFGSTSLFFEFRDAIVNKVSRVNTAFGKQMFFPVYSDEHDYVIVSPVISAGFQRAFHNQIKHGLSSKALDRLFYYPRAYNIVGGSKPLNQSKLNGKFGGRNNQLLFTLPPTDHLTQVERNLLTKGTLLSTPKALPNLLKLNSVHFKSRYQFNKAVVEFCLEAISLVDEYKEQFHHYQSQNLIPDSGVEKKLIEAIPLSRDEQSELSSTLSNILLNKMEHEKAAMTEEVRQQASKAIHQFVKECF